jgi:hypothetical protein
MIVFLVSATYWQWLTGSTYEVYGPLIQEPLSLSSTIGSFALKPAIVFAPRSALQTDDYDKLSFMQTAPERLCTIYASDRSGWRTWPISTLSSMVSNASLAF